MPPPCAARFSADIRCGDWADGGPLHRLEGSEAPRGGRAEEARASGALKEIGDTNGTARSSRVRRRVRELVQRNNTRVLLALIAHDGRARFCGVGEDCR